MKPTNEFNSLLIDFLVKHNVAYTLTEGCLQINRTSMVERGAKLMCGVMYENDIYYWWLAQMEKVLPSHTHISWGVRTDDVLGVEVWI